MQTLNCTDMEFRSIRLEDRPWIEDYCRKANRRQLNYCFEVLFLWRDVCDFELAEEAGFLYIKTFHRSQHNFLFPLGNGNLQEALLRMEEYAVGKGREFRLYQVNNEQKAVIEELMPGQYQFTPYRDEYEYLFESARLSTLQGKVLQPKRNHINYFEKYYHWQTEEIDANNILEIMIFAHKWDMDMDIPPGSALNMENAALINAFESFFCLNLDGLLLRVDGKVAAFAMGCPVNDDTYLILFEKADASVRGAYPKINRDFVNRYCTGYRYVNRAEDNGDEGLRKAKLSYHPDILLEVNTMKRIPNQP